MVRMLLVFLLSFMIAPLPVTSASATHEIEVWKSPSCECCIDWVKHLEDHGFAVKVQDVPQATLERIKRQSGITDRLASCHTGKIDGYVVEGHVPAADIKRLIGEKPDAAGLTVPGMPVGSPGMEVGDEREPYEVLLLKSDGDTEVFAKY